MFHVPCSQDTGYRLEQNFTTNGVDVYIFYVYLTFELVRKEDCDSSFWQDALSMPMF